MKKHLLACAAIAGLVGSAGAAVPTSSMEPAAEVGYFAVKLLTGNEGGWMQASAQNGGAAGGGEIGMVVGRAVSARAAGWMGARLGAAIGAAGGPVGMIIGAMAGAL